MPNRTSVSERVFESDLITIGRFRCPSDHRAWTEENCIGDHPLIVFPRVPVRIRQSGRHEVVADANCVMYYNTQHMYRRGLLHERGDHCEWFRIDEGILADMVAAYRPAVADRPEAPFEFANGPSDATTYLMQRRVFEYALSAENPSPLLIQETMLNVVRRIIAMAFETRGRRMARNRRHATASDHRDRAEAAKAYLALHVSDTIRLSDVAQAVHCSPFHLCRLFRQETGMTLHQYQSQLRLRSALESLSGHRQDLTALAFGLGYSSHSHFTAAFSRSFQCPPSQITQLAAPLRKRARS
ncbi:MAG: helix-turn-helix transcriptional regulator [Planctomycetes bacterium]|nr:helix-turn-helix transcriptional regulator [Planctomycetota bacterium]